MLQLLFDFFSGKAKTRIYTTFLGWLIVLHIDILIITLLTDQNIIYQKTSLLKGEYLWSYLAHFGLWGVAIELSRIIGAALVTYLMIWVIPKLMNERSYRQELEVEYKLREMRIRKDESLNKREEVVVKKQLENIETEKQVAIERVKLEETPEHVKWDMEFESFKTTSAFNAFDLIVKVIYEYSGRFSRAPFNRPDSNAVAYLDANGIITIKEGVFGLTEKGRYFVKKYTEKI